jgi:D-inositol-3-phosphate glycosyltransferase
MRRLAVLSLHTSPLAQPGTGDGGGMNVYVRTLASALARLGISVDVFTRAESADAPLRVDVEPGFSVHHIEAGPRAPMAKEALVEVVETFADGVEAVIRQVNDDPTQTPFGAIHANYWLSGMAGHILKHRLTLALVSTFHTLERVKAEAVPEEVAAELPLQRAAGEAAIIGCSDIVLASCSVEADQLLALYGADPDRVHIVAPGVEHAYFAPGYRPQARRAIGFDDAGTLIVCVGRIQPLKGIDVAVEALAHLPTSGPGTPYRLVVVGGPSGRHGDAALDRLHSRAKALGVAERVTILSPQPHELLSSFYRAADVCVVPSRSESFGLVALEAAACGTPVVASAVGGLTTLVRHGETGFLVEPSDPRAFASAIENVVSTPLLAERLSTAAVIDARRYSWHQAASDLARLLERVDARTLVECG